MIKPLPGYCLIEPIEDDTTSAGGVYLPDSSKDKPSKGKVIEMCLNLGDSAEKFVYDLLDMGDIVVYKKYTNQEVQDEGKTYLLVPFSDLLAIVE